MIPEVTGRPVLTLEPRAVNQGPAHVRVGSARLRIIKGLVLEACQVSREFQCQQLLNEFSTYS